jgi:hypothetical protein
VPILWQPAGDSRSTLRRRLYLVAVVAIVGWFVACRIALLAFGAPQLAELLGQPTYNALLPGHVFTCLLAIVVTLAVDGTLLALPALVRGMRADRPLAQRVAVPALCAVCIGPVAWWACTGIDPLRDRMLALLLRETTLYAPGYSDGAFAGIEPGMSWDEVHALVGAPLDEGPYGGGFVVRYARESPDPADSGWHWRRVVSYDRRGGHVLRVTTGLED